MPPVPAHDGEADLVVVHPEHGLLVIEVKAGEPSRDASGRWFIGDRLLARSPFRQAEAAKHDLVGAIDELLGLTRRRPRPGRPCRRVPGRGPGQPPRGPRAPRPGCAGRDHPGRRRARGHDATRRALERAWAWWTGDGTRGRPLTQPQLERIHEFLAPTVVLHRLIRRDVEDGRDRLIDASRAQRIVLNQNRSRRRLEIVGPAGSGKSLVAVERARRLAREGFRTLFVCFNQPLATAVGREIDEDGEPADRRPIVTTFHRLCERLGTQAGVLPAKPAGALPRDWWDVTLPGALDAAIDALPGERFHAIVIDEGQDFEPAWLASLGFLLHDPADGVLWVFHDPGQALYRDDRVAELGLDRLELFEDYRSPAPVAELAARFYHGPTEPYPVTEAGRKPVVVVAEPGRDTVEAVRKQLHRLLEDEDIRPWHVAVLSGVSATRSEVWKRRRFGNVELWNGAIDAAGASLGLPAGEIPDTPPDTGIVLFETVRRFKGLERPVIILCELPDEGERLDQLLYTAFTRATAHLVVIAPPALATRLDER